MAVPFNAYHTDITYNLEYAGRKPFPNMFVHAKASLIRHAVDMHLLASLAAYNLNIGDIVYFDVEALENGKRRDEDHRKGYAAAITKVLDLDAGYEVQDLEGNDGAELVLGKKRFVHVIDAEKMFKGI